MGEWISVNKMPEDENGRHLLGGGCKKCPVDTCATSTYRGSACRVQRAAFGLGDPLTNADRIRAMTDEELAEWILAGVSCDPCDYCKHSSVHCISYQCKSDEETILEWLRQPVKED